MAQYLSKIAQSMADCANKPVHVTVNGKHLTFFPRRF